MSELMLACLLPALERGVIWVETPAKGKRGLPQAMLGCPMGAAPRGSLHGEEQGLGQSHVQHPWSRAGYGAATERSPLSLPKTAPS